MPHITLMKYLCKFLFLTRSVIEERRISQLLQVLNNEGLLSCIKSYCDWMRCHPHIIATCAQSSQSLWSRLSVLLNFLPTEENLYNQGMDKLILVLTI